MIKGLASLLAIAACAWAGSAAAATNLALSTGDGIHYSGSGALPSITTGRTYQAIFYYEGLIPTLATFMLGGVEYTHSWDPINGNEKPYDGHDHPRFAACNAGNGCLKEVSPGVAVGTLYFDPDYSFPCGPSTPIGTLCSRFTNWSTQGPETMFDFQGYTDGSGVAPKVSYSFAAIPEPSTWAMMIVGFGAVGTMVRASRRRRAFA